MLPPAAASRRLKAFAIDVAIAALPAGIASALAVAATQSLTSAPAAAWAAGIGAFMAATTVVAIAEILIFGTTAGTRAGKLTVLGPDGAVAGRRRLMRRELARLVLVELPAMVAGAGLLGVAPCVSRRRAWHDVASGTRVVAHGEPDLEPFAAVRGRRVARSGAEFAPFSERAGAFLIDLGLVATVWATAAGVLALAIDVDSQKGTPRWFGITIAVLFPVIDLAYRVTALAWRGTTVGLGAVGYVVRRSDDEGDVRTRRALRRELVRLLVFASLFVAVGAVLVPLDLLFPLWQPRGQTLHDQMGGTIVVRGEPRPWRRPRPVPAPPPEPLPA